MTDRDRQDYERFQITASEMMRSATEMSITDDERLFRIAEYRKWALKAFIAADENPFARIQALQIIGGAAMMEALIETGFKSIVTRVIDTETVEDERAGST
jgi:hypothetical protein